MISGVHIEGLREVGNAMKAMAGEVAKQYKRELAEIGEDVMHDAQARMPVKSAAALQSMKTGANQSGAYVQGGKKRVPYYGWLDFGSRRPVRGRPRSVGPWKASGKGPTRGRFLYPAVDRNARNIQKRANEVVERAMRKLSL